MTEIMPVAEPQDFPFSNYQTLSAASTCLVSPNIWISGPSPSLLLQMPFSLWAGTSMKDLPPQCLESKHPCSSVSLLPPYSSGLCGEAVRHLQEHLCAWDLTSMGKYRSNPWISEQTRPAAVCPCCSLSILTLRDSSKVEAASALCLVPTTRSQLLRLCWLLHY